MNDEQRTGSASPPYDILEALEGMRRHHQLVGDEALERDPDDRRPPAGSRDRLFAKKLGELIRDAREQRTSAAPQVWRCRYHPESPITDVSFRCGDVETAPCASVSPEEQWRAAGVPGYVEQPRTSDAKLCKHDDGGAQTFICLLCGVSRPFDAYPFPHRESRPPFGGSTLDNPSAAERDAARRRAQKTSEDRRAPVLTNDEGSVPAPLTPPLEVRGSGEASTISAPNACVAVPEWPRYTTAPADADAVVQRLCRLLSDVWDKYEPEGHTPNDCFCGHGGFGNAGKPSWRNDGASLAWVEALVRAALSVSKESKEKKR